MANDGMQWIRLIKSIKLRPPPPDFREALVINWCCLVEDQKTLDKSIEMRAYRRGNNEVVLVTVDGCGSPSDCEVRDRVEKGRRVLGASREEKEGGA